jgi:hypothetical protein
MPDDPAIAGWFLAAGDRANPATEIRAFTTGNLVRPLVDGRSYFARLARDLRLRLWREHLDRHAGDTADLLDPREAFAAFGQQAQQLAAWHRGGRSRSRPPGRVLAHQRSSLTSVQRLWATPLYRMVYDPDGRPWRDRLRRRL